MKVAAITIRRKPVGPINTNTGNYMFTETVYRNIDADVEWVGFSFDPDQVNDNYDAVVIPAANWFNSSSDFTNLLARLERVKLPITCMGMGAQADSTSARSIAVSPSAKRLAEFLSHKNYAISVRGEFTQAILADHGVHNTVVTGCPSLYMDVAQHETSNPSGGIVLQGTRYVMSPNLLRSESIDNKIFRAAGRHGHDIVYQSERLELSYMDSSRKDDWEHDVEKSGLPQLYGLDTAADMRNYLDKHGRAFTDLDTWAAYLQTKAGVIGTRLHGTILALNSGVPAVLIPHDSRTQELADFACLPTAKPTQIFREGDGAVQMPADLGAQLARYRRVRDTNRDIYVDFLAKNGLRYKRSHSERSST